MDNLVRVHRRTMHCSPTSTRPRLDCRSGLTRLHQGTEVNVSDESFIVSNCRISRKSPSGASRRVDFIIQAVKSALQLCLPNPRGGPRRRGPSHWARRHDWSWSVTNAILVDVRDDQFVGFKPQPDLPRHGPTKDNQKKQYGRDSHQADRQEKPPVSPPRSWRRRPEESMSRSSKYSPSICDRRLWRKLRRAGPSASPSVRSLWRMARAALCTLGSEVSWLVKYSITYWIVSQKELGVVLQASSLVQEACSAWTRGGCVEEEKEGGEVGPSGAIYREGFTHCLLFQEIRFTHRETHSGQFVRVETG